jgi:hypothetical protein
MQGSTGLAYRVPVAITIVRLPQNANHATAQVNRTTWASAELLTAAFVANAPALYTLCKRKDSSNPPHLQPSLPPKDSNYTTGNQRAPPGQPLDQNELQTGPQLKPHDYPDIEKGRQNSDRDPQNGILVTTEIHTEYSPRTMPK